MKLKVSLSSLWFICDHEIISKLTANAANAFRRQISKLGGGN